MDQLVSRLLLYGDLGEDSILRRLAEHFQEWQGHSTPRQTLVRGLYHQVKRLLDLATDFPPKMLFQHIFPEQCVPNRCEDTGSHSPTTAPKTTTPNPASGNERP